MTNNGQPFLTYYFHGFKFEFIENYVQVSDERYYAQKRIFKIMFNGNPELPFTIQLERIEE